MKILFTAFAALALLLSPAATQADDAEPIRALFVTQSAGFKHGSVNRKQRNLAPAEIAMQQLGQQSKLFKLDSTQDAAADFTKENLQNYDLVMFYTTGKLPIADDDLDYFLNEWMHEEGHGFIGFHSATDTYKNHKPFWDFVGGTFDGHPWSSRATVVISVHDQSHPAAKPWGSEFTIQDEIYWYKNWQPEKVRVLMSLNMAKTELKRPRHVPVAWVKEVGKGRMFYTNLGHREETWTNKTFLKSVVGAVRWIRRMEDANADPNPEVSAEEVKKAQAAAGKKAA